MKQTMKHVALAAIMASMALSLKAKEWYVDASASAEGADGSQAKPYPVIQTAVDRASDDDTIYVAEGVYSSGETQLDGPSYSRVDIAKKLHLIGAGRGKSIITGSRDSAAMGFATKDKYVRCVCVQTSGTGTVVEGFTLRDGEGDPGTSGYRAYSGGFYAKGDSLDVYLVDSDIEHCSAGLGGGADGGTLVRCRLKDNYGNSGPATRASRLINCIVTGTRSSVNSRAVFNKGELYNCTAIDNAVSAWTLEGKAAAYNCLFALNTTSGVYYREAYSENETTNDCALGSIHKNFMLVAGPAVGDYRPLADSAAVAAGRISHLSSLSLPEGIDALKDFNGRTIVADGEGRINAGAIQEIMTPAGGALLFGDGMISTTDRYEVANGPIYTSPYYTWVYPDVYPTQYCVRATMGEGEHLQHLARLPLTSSVETGLYPPSVPDRNGVMWLMPPPDPSVVSTNQARKAKTVLYVDPDPTVGSDTQGDGSESAPFYTIQKAISSIDGNTLVYLRPGEYTNDVQTTSVPGRGRYRFYVEFNVVNNVNNTRVVRIVSTDGPERTIIRGAPDPDSTETGDFAGMGPNAIKGAYIEGNGVILQGLTLADCYTDSTNAVDSRAMMGAALHGVSGAQSSRSLVFDCVITNCHASSYVVAYPMNLLRCRFYDSISPRTYPIYGGVLFSGYTRGVTSTIVSSGHFGIVGGNATIYQSTFIGELDKGRVTGGDNISYNSIWYGGKNIYSTSHYTNCIVYNPSGSTAQGTFRKVDPRFADLSASGAVRADSPAIGTGDVPGVDNFGMDYWKYACGDVEGNPIVFNTAGQPTLGAFQTPVEIVTVTASAPANGGWAFADGHSFGTFDLWGGETLSITNASGTRNCIALACGGLEYAFSNAPNGVISIPYADIAGEGTVTLSAIYSTDWYVDAVNGSDANSGFSVSTAKRTLAAATVPMVAGDTLWALPGIYNDGLAAQGSAALLVSNRVVVKEGTAVVSTEGPESTVIMGADATIDPDANGCGTNAVRCAYVSKNSRLSGFTLTGGRINMTNAAQTDDGSGSAVAGFGRSYGCVVENCIISNNYSRYGTAFKCDLFGCRVTDNTATTGSGVRQGNAYGCWFDRNYGDPVISYPQYVWNCTLTRGNTKVKGNVAMANSLNNPVQYTDIRNTFFGSSVNLSSADSSMTYSVVHSSGGSIKAGSITNGLIIVDTNTQSFNTDGTPMIGFNLAVDAGDASLNTNVLGNVDLRGFQRVMNGRMDIGCFEADWREKYKAALSPMSAFAVMAADPQVVLTNDTEMTVRDGTLSVEWTNTSGKSRIYGCDVMVTGTGTLTATLNGEPFATVVAADGAKRLEFRSAAAANVLSFTYEPGENDDGWAVLSYLSRESGGLRLNIR